MNSIEQQTLTQAIQERRIEWRKHVLQKLAERGISQDAVLQTLLHGDRIREYKEDKPFPSALYLGYVDKLPLHVVASFDKSTNYVYIITAYQPSTEYYEFDFRTRKK